MLPEKEVRIEYARAASADEINSLVYEADEKLLLALLDNPNFHERHADLLAGRADVSSAVLTALAEAANGKWMGCESVRLRVAQHRHSPKRLAMAAVRQLFLFNLVRLSLAPSAPQDVRRLAEDAILSRVPHLPIGEKLTLARRGPSRVAGAILAEGHPQALKLALSNRFLTESQVLKTLAIQDLSERVVAAIAKHPKWSSFYNVRTALLRHPLAAAAYLHSLIADVKIGDLKEISKLRDVSHELRNLILRELERRKTKIGEVASEISGAA